LSKEKTNIRLINASSSYFPNFNELREYKGLLYFLVLKDIKTRYSQSVIGIGWAVIQPIFFMIVFTIIFGKLAKIDSQGVPYAVFSYCALVPWTFFSNALSDSANSLITNITLVTHIYIPRILIPVSAVTGKFIDFLIALVILLAMVLWFGFNINFKIFLSLFYIILMFISALGFGLILGTMAAQYRDIKHALAFGVQLFMYATPVAYSSDMIPENYRIIYAINPMVTVVEGFRDVFINAGVIDLNMIIVSSISGFVLLIIGLIYFSKIERIFADVI
tara:strand:- start:2838 stop:3668 length:831 start_codon:yes stop_codon:yes gene_type:complete